MRPLIVSRANLLHALASASGNIPSGTPTDAAIRDQLMTELAKQPWSPQLNATVRDGVVELWVSSSLRTSAKRQWSQPKTFRASRSYEAMWPGSSPCGHGDL